MTKEYKDLNRNEKIALKSFLNSENKCLNDVVEETGIQFHTILGYAQDPDFIRLVNDARKAFENK